MAVESQVRKTWKPIAAGILSIISGTWGIYVGAWLVIGGFLIGEYVQYPAVGALLVVVAVVAIVGGFVMIIRKLYRLALAGVICAIPAGGIPLFIFGVSAVILVVASKREFS